MQHILKPDGFEQFPSLHKFWTQTGLYCEGKGASSSRLDRPKPDTTQPESTMSSSSKMRSLASAAMSD